MNCKKIALFLTLSALNSCQTRKFNSNIQSIESRTMTPHGDALWNVYVNNLPLKELQEECKPRRFKVPEGTQQLGSVFLYHGFTACPQQYFEWAQKLNEAGYEVFLPLNPGHGLKRINGTTDRFESLPNEVNYWEVLSNFTVQINEIAQEAGGEKIVGGLSQGASLAAWSAWTGQKIYNRALIMTPLFQLSDKKAKIVSGTIQNFKPLLLPFAQDILSKDYDWGEGCEIEISRTPPRNGICKFKVRNAFASQQFGWDVVDKIGAINMPIQGIGVTNDSVVNNERFKVGMAKLAYGNTGILNSNLGKIEKATGNDKFQLCYYPSGEKQWLETNFKVSNGANHSLLSRFDSPDENKWWLNQLMEHATAFVTKGTHFPSNTSFKYKDTPFCDL